MSDALLPIRQSVRDYLERAIEYYRRPDTPIAAVNYIPFDEAECGYLLAMLDASERRNG